MEWLISHILFFALPQRTRTQIFQKSQHFLTKPNQTKPVVLYLHSHLPVYFLTDQSHLRSREYHASTVIVQMHKTETS